MRHRKYEYRYRDHSGGHTQRSRQALVNLPKIGVPVCVRGYCYRAFPRNNQLGVLVRGSNGTARFGGFCWGYGGTGPNGLRDLFTHLRIPAQIADYVAFGIESPDFSKARNYWEIILQSDGGYHVRLFDEHNEVIAHSRYTLQSETVFHQLQLAI